MSLSHSLANVGRAVAYYPTLSKFFGSINASIFFTQLHYWQSRTSDERGVHKTSDQWTEETGLSYREQATARQHLVKQGFLIETPERLKHRIYFRLDLLALDASFEAWTKAQFANDENAIGEMRKAQSAEDVLRSSPSAANAVGGLTKTHSVNKEKITTEITAETTAESVVTPPRKRRKVTPKKAPESKLQPKKTANVDVEPAPSVPLLITAGNGTVYEIPGDLRYPGEGTKTHKAWIAYAIAYHGRYHSWPVWNGTVGGQISNFIERVGIERAPRIAVHYVRRVHEEFVVKQMHPVKLLQSDAEKWATQCDTGRTVTSEGARQMDRTATNANTAEGAVEKALALVTARRAREAAARQEGGANA